MVSPLASLIQLHREVQVEDNLRIKSKTRRIYHRKTFGIAGLRITSKSTTSSRGGSAHHLFLTKSVKPNHRRERKTRKNS